MRPARPVFASQQTIELTQTQGGGAGLIAPEMELGRPEPQPTKVGTVRKNGHRERADSLGDGLVVPRGGATRADVYDYETLGTQRDEKPSRTRGSVGGETGESGGQIAEIQGDHGDPDPAQGEQFDDAIQRCGIARASGRERLADGLRLSRGRSEFRTGRETEFHGSTVAVVRRSVTRKRS